MNAIVARMSEATSGSLVPHVAMARQRTRHGSCGLLRAGEVIE
jgi:hypothetical protein